MEIQLTSKDKKRIEKSILGKYAKVAVSPENLFEYPTGLAGLKALNYDPKIIQVMPVAVSASYCGVGNPFSLGQIGEDEDDETRGVFGFRYLLPLNVESRVWIDTDGGGRFNLGKSFELTPRLALLGEAEYDTHDNWEGSAGLSYMVHKYFSLVGQWHSEYGFGAGLQIRF